MGTYTNNVAENPISLIKMIKPDAWWTILVRSLLEFYDQVQNHAVIMPSASEINYNIRQNFIDMTLVREAGIYDMNT